LRRSLEALSSVERAFRCLKTVDLKVRPIHHRLEKRVRAHIFLCMLACFRTLLQTLSTIVRNLCRIPGEPTLATFPMTTTPNTLQHRARELLAEP